MSKKCLTLDDVERLGRESGDWRAAFYTLFDWLKDKTGSEMKLTQFANSEGLGPILARHEVAERNYAKQYGGPERDPAFERVSAVPMSHIDRGVLLADVERLRAALKDIGECECSCESGATCMSCCASEALL